MQFIEAIILGIVQGLTEFLPISSSAHLRIIGEFLPSAQDPGATFTAITQIGTETAVLGHDRACHQALGTVAGRQGASQ
jgi:undecaprenyl-diphosphatase